MFLKTYEGDVSDLCLNFTVSTDDFGVRGSEAEVPLMENGANVEVTNENKRSYIYLMAKYHCSDRIKEQSSAFTRGLWDVIDRSWLRLFNEPELQVLISGASDGRIDVADMKVCSRFARMHCASLVFTRSLSQIRVTRDIRVATQCSTATSFDFGLLSTK